MCLGIPGQVVQVLDPEQRIEKVDVSGVRRAISLGLAPEADQGDWVLVHVGFALSRIDEAEAAATLDQIKRLGRSFDEEMAAFEESGIQ